MDKRKKVNQICTHIEISRTPFVRVVLNRLRDKYTDELKKKTAIEYVLFDRDMTTDIICNSPTCIIRTEPRLKRILAKKIHRNTRTLREATIDLAPQEDLNSSSNATESSYSHIILGDSGDKSINNNNNNAEGSTAETTPSPPVVVLQPASDADEHEIRVARNRVYYYDLKGSSDGDTEITVTLEEPHKKTFDATAQLCHVNGQSKAVMLQTVAKVLDFDSNQIKALKTKLKNSDSYVERTADGADFQQPDGADFIPITVAASKRKLLYSPPANTLTMNFNGDGQFFIV